MQQPPADVWRALFDHALDGMIITDAEARVLAVNPAMERISGYTGEEWSGRNPRLMKSGRTPQETYREMWVALKVQGHWLGEMINRRPDGTDWTSFLSITTIRGAAGEPRYYVGVVRDITEFRLREQELHRRIAEVDLTQETAIFTLAQLAELRDPDVAGHLERMRLTAAAIVDALADQRHSTCCDPIFRTQVVRASLLHDIGKVGVPEAILLKPGRLTADEFAVVKRHTEIGGQLLDRADHRLRRRLGTAATFLTTAAETARYHHERWDGTGYPAGLAGEEIPLPARIVAVADVYDALTSERVYKKAWNHQAACEYIAGAAGKHFDPAVTEAFLSRYGSHCPPWTGKGAQDLLCN